MVRSGGLLLAAFLLHLTKPLHILWNALCGKETRKLETHLVDLRKEAGITIRNKFRKVGKQREPAAA